MKKNKPNTTELIYQGDVEFSVKTKNGQIYKINQKNNGGIYLKYIFAKALIGEFDDLDTPGFINLVKLESSGEESMYLDKEISISGTQLVDSVEGLPTATTVTAYITYDDLIEQVQPTETADFYLYLLTKTDENRGVNSKHILAKFKLTAQTLAYITPGTTATINWTLRIINKGADIQ